MIDNKVIDQTDECGCESMLSVQYLSEVMRRATYEGTIPGLMPKTDMRFKAQGARRLSSRETFLSDRSVWGDFKIDFVSHAKHSLYPCSWKSTTPTR